MPANPSSDEGPRHPFQTQSCVSTLELLSSLLDEDDDDDDDDDDDVQ